MTAPSACDTASCSNRGFKLADGARPCGACMKQRRQANSHFRTPETLRTLRSWQPVRNERQG